jgi:hypothetical protein
MNRIGLVLTVLAPLAFAAPAAGDTPQRPPVIYQDVGNGHKFGLQPLPAYAMGDVNQADTESNIIFVNRCVGGCTVIASSVNNASTQQSTIPQGFPDGTKIALAAFPYSDTSWNLVMSCVKEIYSPYNVVVTDQDPGPTVVHTEIIVTGSDPVTTLNLQGAAGISPISPDHTPFNNNLAYAFASDYADDPAINRPYGLYDLCATIGQETAHSFGLDHEFECTDPMTYKNPCGGIKYFRNQDFQCGAYAASDCNCCFSSGPGQQCNPGCQDAGPTQNSHQRLLGVFGAGQSTTPPPVVSITSPADGDHVSANFPVVVNSSSKRGTAAVKIFLNGYLWVEKDPGFDPAGGPTAPIYAPTYVVITPTAVPDGVIDVEAQACDDLGSCTSAKLTVTKGAPCADASTCAKGQKCDAGKCYWDPPAAQLGDACSFPQECVSGLCIGDGTNDVCSQTCFVGGINQCPSGFTCTLNAQGTQAYCFADSGGGGGCCSAGDSAATAVAAQGGLAVLVIAVGFRRRRRA